MPGIVLIAIIGLVGGVLAGLFGIRGGLVILPALILVAGFPGWHHADRRSRNGPARTAHSLPATT